MNPALSVIFFTTLIGAGQGLFIALYGAQWAMRLGWAGATGSRFFALGALVCVVLCSCGLLAERWFFFAQANHPQNLYYQAIA